MTEMRPIRETIPLQEAREIIQQATAPVERIERVKLADANGRVLAADIVSPMDVPPFARAAMDGYAVIAADTFGAGQFDPKVLRVVETVYTGQVPTRHVGAAECTEIATGAPLPQGADAVVMVEETERADGDVRVFSPVYPAQNVGRQGADIKAGQAILARGELLTPARIGSVAAVGIDEVDVFGRPRVAILSTGNEIVAPGEPLPPGAIYDINKFTLTAIISEHGGVALPRTTVPDTVEDLGRALGEAAEADLIVFSGGSSVGERDLILDVLMEKGEVLFHGIAVKPGKPTLFGLLPRPRTPDPRPRTPDPRLRTPDPRLRTPDSGLRTPDSGLRTPVLGMPGYPTSCLSNGYMLLAPMLRRLAHLPPYEPRTVTLPLGQRVVSTTGRHQFYTVRIVDGVAMPAFKASGDITSMSRADGYIEIPAQTDIVEKGQMVDVRLF